MENFLNWDVLLTFGGCVAGTVLLTEWLKKVFSKIPAQVVSFAIAFAILFIGRLATDTFAWSEIPLNLINAAAVSLSSNGSFDILQKAFGKKEDYDEMVIDPDDPEATTGVYLNIVKDPKEFKDGEIVSFKVKKLSQ